MPVRLPARESSAGPHRTARRAHANPDGAASTPAETAPGPSAGGRSTSSAPPACAALPAKSNSSGARRPFSAILLDGQVAHHGDPPVLIVHEPDARNEWLDNVDLLQGRDHEQLQ